MQDLRQSTAGQVVVFGPFIDDTDFKTAETALTIANTDIKLRTHAATTYANKNIGGATHIEGGYYHATFDATDSATLGRLDVKIKVAGALDVTARFMVLSASEFDAKYALTGPVPSLGIVARGTAQSATATTLVLAASEVIGDSVAIGMTLMAFGSTQGYWQSRQVTGYVLATDTATVDTWTVTPSGTITYLLMGSPPASTTVLPAVNVAQVSGDTIAADTLELFVEKLDQVTGQIISGTLATDAITAAKLAADASVEIVTTMLATTIDGVTVADYLSAAGGARFSIAGNVLTVMDVAGNTIYTRNLTLGARNPINVAAL